MDITFYLVELLRLHDCVVVPDLGGFITNYRPAGMDLAGNRFSPPVKDIIFTGKLNKNDGLLVNFISETEGIGYLEARQIISEFVDETWSILENGEIIEFQNIGILQFDRNGKLIFEPKFHQNFLLDAYGMEGFQFPQLEKKEIITKRNFTDKDSVRPVFSSRKVKALLVGVSIFLAVIYIPVSKYSKNTNRITQVSSTTAIPMSIMGDSTTPTTVESKASLFTNSGSKASLVANSGSAVLPSPKFDSLEVKAPIVQKTAEPVTITANVHYRVIGGYFKSRQNADKFCEKLRTSGFKSELKVLPNESFLVIVQSYTDKSEATAALKTLRDAEPQTGYWMSVN